jgi:hypothetical protein
MATVINVAADCLFVVPSATHRGLRCKLLAITLEIVQLGLLAPAAVLERASCIRVIDVPGVSLDAVRSVYVAFGYLVWSFAVALVPLGLIGLALAALALGAAAALMVACSWLCRMRPSLRVIPPRWLESESVTLLLRVSAWPAKLREMRRSLCVALISFAAVPMCAMSIFLAGVVVVGEAGKGSGRHVYAAIVLIADIVFKVVATVASEGYDYALHIRVRRTVAHRNARATASWAVPSSASAREVAMTVSGPSVLVPTPVHVQPEAVSACDAVMATV